MDKKKIQVAIIVLTTIVFLLVLLLIIMNINKKHDEVSIYDDHEASAIEYMEENANKISIMKDRMALCDVKSCIAKFYLNAYNLNSDSPFVTDSDREYYKKSMYYSLNKDYIAKNGITLDNIGDKIKVDEQYIVEIYNAYLYTSFNDVNVNFVNGALRGFNTGVAKEFNMVVTLDTKNMTYEIFLDDWVANIDIKSFKVGNTVEFDIPEAVENREYNVYSRATVKLDEFCQDYCTMIKNLLIYDIDTAYEHLNELGKQNYISKYELEDFVNTNKKNLVTMTYGSYDAYTLDGVPVYRVYDKKNMFYIDFIFEDYSNLNFNISKI